MVGYVLNVTKVNVTKVEMDIGYRQKESSNSSSRVIKVKNGLKQWDLW